MNKEFFETFDTRTQAFAQRAGVEAARAEMTLGNGRTVVIDKIVELTDAWLQVDAHDPSDEAVPVSLVMPYWQIVVVTFVQDKQVKRAGFTV